MADENNPGTSATPTTSGTGTSPADGSATGTSQNNGGLAAALGDGTGAAQPAESAAGDTPPKPTDKPAAPETYAAFTVPEGLQLDPGLVEEATPIFKELGLNQDQAQKLVDFYNKNANRSDKAVMDAWSQTRSDWRESMKNDPVLSKLAGQDGNFGTDSPLVRTVNQALNGLQDPKLVSDFKAAMDLTGAGDNPAFVRVLHALASKVTEGTSYAQGTPTKTANARPSAGGALYPNLPSQNG